MFIRYIKNNSFLNALQIYKGMLIVHSNAMSKGISKYIVDIIFLEW